jgi:hypothetical protein
MTTDEQRLYLVRARAYIASQMASTESCFTKNKSDWDAALKEVDQISEPDEQDLCKIAKNLKGRNGSGFWSKFTKVAHLVGWLRFRGRCAYCDKDLIEGQYIRHGWATTDHLLPQSKYPDLDRESLNTVPACSACNCLKGGMDPSQDASSGPSTQTS